MTNPHWTPADDQLLLDTLPRGLEAAAEAFGSRRSLRSIQRRAKALGIGPSTHVAPWSDEEEGLLRAHYPLGGSKAVEKQLGGTRSRAAIRARAKLLGLRRSGRAIWTPERLRILERLYPAEGATAVRDALGGLVTLQAIISMARLRGLKRASGFRATQWLSEDDGVVRANYPDGGAERVHAMLQGRRSKAAITARARALGVKRRKEPDFWNTERVALLLRVYPAHGAAAVEAALQSAASVGQIRAAAARLGLKRSPGSPGIPLPWGAEEDAILAKHYRAKGADGVFALLGGTRSVTAIQTRACEKGVTGSSSPDWTKEELAVLSDLVVSKGLQAACDALSGEKSAHAVRRKARDLGLNWQRGRGAQRARAMQASNRQQSTRRRPR
jgi:hypothetical protein